MRGLTYTSRTQDSREEEKMCIQCKCVYLPHKVTGTQRYTQRKIKFYFLKKKDKRLSFILTCASEEPDE